MNLGRIEVPFGAQTLIIESGRLAKQANGAVTVTCGGTVVLVTVCMDEKMREEVNFFPLMVEYQEKTYSAGRIPGGFFKREGRPTEKEILTARLIDRPVRTLFPDGMRNNLQIVASVLSSDAENDPDVMAIVGASAALMISDIPFCGPIGAVRVGLIDDQVVLNPTYQQREQSVLDLVIVGHKDGIVMIESEANEVPEDKILMAVQYGFESLQPIAAIQNELQKEIGKPKIEVELISYSQEFIQKVKDMSSDQLAGIYQISDEQRREESINSLLDEITEDMTLFSEFKYGDREITKENIRAIFEQIEYEEMRRLIFAEQKRSDGRGFNDLRDISCEVNILPRTHGSGLFTRGQTQSLAVVTLGTRTDEQLIEALGGKSYKSFMLHYNFPSFSVGETRPMRGPGRREIGHGALALKAIKAMLPEKEDFPYTIRVVSEILESNGSSSMASVCSGALALMDAGVPIKSAIAGVSIGLITNEKEEILLTDIMGIEDHFGDMDFKVAGTREGVNAIQLDLKIKGIHMELLARALEQAKEARIMILDKMHAVISSPRKEISQYAPRIATLRINPEKISELIGPGGKMIKKIIEQTGVTSIDIEDDGKVLIFSTKKEEVDQAIQTINNLMEEPEVGKVYHAKVKRIMDFGAICEFLPGKDGLVHISELSNEFVKDIKKVVKIGDEFKVKLIEIDQMGRMNLSRKKAE